MKKIKLSLLFVCIVLMFGIQTQAQAFEKGNNFVSLGYGFPNFNTALFKAFDENEGFSYSGIGPIHVKFEHAVSDHFGIGLSINGVSASASYKENNYNYEFNRSSIKFNARVNYHFGEMEKFDPYIGMGFGYGTSRTKLTTKDPNGSNESFPSFFPIGWESTIGTRYLLTDNIGIYTEVGLAKSLIQFGGCFKF